MANVFLNTKESELPYLVFHFFVLLFLHCTSTLCWQNTAGTLLCKRSFLTGTQSTVCFMHLVKYGRKNVCGMCVLDNNAWLEPWTSLFRVNNCITQLINGTKLSFEFATIYKQPLPLKRVHTENMHS